MLRLALFAVLTLFFSLGCQAGALRLGIAPYLSSRTLLIEHAPLKAFLEKRLGTAVNIGTASNLHTFAGRLVGGEFDIALIPPHLARVAQADYGYRPLYGIKSDFYALVLVNKNDPAVNIADLKGRELNLPHRLSLVALQIESYLRRLELDPTRDLKLLYHSTDNNAALALAGGSRGAAATSRTVFERMPPEIVGKLRILGSTPSVISLVFVANPRLPAAQLAAVSAALDEFPYSEAGMSYFQGRGVSLVPVGDADLSVYDGLLPALRKDLREFLP